DLQLQQDLLPAVARQLAAERARAREPRRLAEAPPRRLGSLARDHEIGLAHRGTVGRDARLQPELIAGSAERRRERCGHRLRAAGELPRALAVGGIEAGPRPALGVARNALRQLIALAAIPAVDEAADADAAPSARTVGVGGAAAGEPARRVDAALLRIEAVG